MLPKLGFSLQKEYGRPTEQVIELLHSVGFSAVSPIFSHEAALTKIDACVRKHGMTVQSLHAPNKVAPLWSNDEAVSSPVFGKVMACIDACAKFRIPVMVLHSWQGLIYTFPQGPLYFDNFDRIVDYAQKKNTAIAFENLEGEEYLDALMTRYKDFPHVGFCWDSGHENCYPHKLDFLEKFGDRLMMTHINDNLGLRDPAGVPSGVDDLHYLPWDGNIDWNKNLTRLAKSKQLDILNFELKIRSQADTLYSEIPLEQFLMQAGLRARKMAEDYAVRTAAAINPSVNAI